MQMICYGISIILNAMSSVLNIEEEMFVIRGCKKGLARGDERGLRVASRSRRPLRRRSEGRRRTAISCPFYASGPRVRQTRYQKATHAHLQGVGAGRGIWGAQKKGLHPKMEPYESGGKRTREEETPFAVGPCRGRRIQLSPVSLFCGTEGGGFGAASQRQVEYACAGPFRQCMGTYVSHASSAGKVSLLDPFCRRRAHGSFSC